MAGRPAVRVIVLNGGSSSGKSSVARALQQLAPETWLTFGVDAFIDALPDRGDGPRADITYLPDGAVETGADFDALEQAWRVGLAAMARHGAHLILDEVFLSGGATQVRLREALGDVTVLWVGVHCDPDVASAREAARPDRVPGMARTQAHAVHAGMSYDLEIDTTSTSAHRCAHLIAARIIRPTAG